MPKTTKRPGTELEAYARKFAETVVKSTLVEYQNKHGLNLTDYQLGRIVRIALSDTKLTPEGIKKSIRSTFEDYRKAKGIFTPAEAKKVLDDVASGRKMHPKIIIAKAATKYFSEISHTKLSKEEADKVAESAAEMGSIPKMVANIRANITDLKVIKELRTAGAETERELRAGRVQLPEVEIRGAAPEREAKRVKAPKRRHVAMFTFSTEGTMYKVYVRLKSAAEVKKFDELRKLRDTADEASFQKAARNLYREYVIDRQAKDPSTVIAVSEAKLDFGPRAKKPIPQVTYVGNLSTNKQRDFRRAFLDRLRNLRYDRDFYFPEGGTRARPPKKKA